MIDLDSPSPYEKIIQQTDDEQIRLVVNVFCGTEYISLRKYYISFEEEWLPTRNGITMKVDFENTRRFFEGLVVILSLAESKSVLEEQFKEQLDEIYLP